MEKDNRLLFLQETDMLSNSLEVWTEGRRGGRRREEGGTGLHTSSRWDDNGDGKGHTLISARCSVHKQQEDVSWAGILSSFIQGCPMTDSEYNKINISYLIISDSQIELINTVNRHYKSCTCVKQLMEGPRQVYR